DLQPQPRWCVRVTLELGWKAAIHGHAKEAVDRLLAQIGHEVASVGMPHARRRAEREARATLLGDSERQLDILGRGDRKRLIEAAGLDEHAAQVGGGTRVYEVDAACAFEARVLL